MEDQADRAGLRYAWEAGYDITKGPALWSRFAKKYGEGSAALSFFFSDHSQAAVRAANLEREIALNYPDGPRPDGPARRQEAPSEGAVSPAGAVETAGSPGEAEAEAGEVRPGMTPDEVRRLLGEPDSALVFGERLRWAYPDRTVVFEDDRVTEVRE
jgi:hypothetical protein